MRYHLALVALAVASAGFADDRHGDPLPPGSVARFGTVRFRQESGVALRFDRAGKVLVACGHSSARAFDPATGKLLAVLEPGPGLISAADLAPDGKILYTLHGRRILATDLATGQSERLRDGELYFAQHADLKVSADGKVLAVADPDNSVTRPPGKTGYVRLIDLTTGKDLFVSEGFAYPKAPLALSPDGSLFAVGVSEAFVIHDWRARQDRLRHKNPFTQYFAAAYAPDGKTVAVHGLHQTHGTVEVRDALTGRVLAVPGGKLAYTPSLRFTADGSGVLATSYTRRPVLLDPAGKKPPRELLPDAPEYLLHSEFSQNGRWLAAWDGLYGGTVRVWDLTTGKEVPQADDRWMEAVPSPDGRRVATRGPEALAVWDAATGKPVWRLDGGGFGSELRWTEDGKQVTASHNGEVVWWDAATGRRDRAVKVEQHDLMAVSVRGGRVFATYWKYENGHEDFEIDPRTGKRTPWGGPDPHQTGWGVKISPDGRRVVEPDYDKVGVVLRTPGGRAGWRADLAGQETIPTVAFSPDGKAVVAAGKFGIRSWDAATGRELGAARPPDEVILRGHVQWLAVSPDGRTAAVAVSVYERHTQPDGRTEDVHTGRTALHLYDLRTGLLKRDLGRFDALERVTFLRDGRRLLVLRHGYAELLDPDSP